MAAPRTRHGSTHPKAKLSEDIVTAMRYHTKKAESIDDELERAFRDGESCGAEDCAAAIRYGIAEWLGST